MILVLSTRDSVCTDVLGEVVQVIPRILLTSYYEVHSFHFTPASVFFVFSCCSQYGPKSFSFILSFITVLSVNKYSLSKAFFVGQDYVNILLMHQSHCYWPGSCRIVTTQPLCTHYIQFCNTFCSFILSFHCE